VTELVVVAVDLVDDLLGAADKRRAALDEVLQGREDRLQAEPFEGRQLPFEDGPVGVDSRLGVAGGEVAGAARADRDVGLVVPVELPALPSTWRGRVGRPAGMWAVCGGTRRSTSSRWPMRWFRR
jgi:hypothetical protein